jgi:serine/threonine protein kinase
MGIFGSNKGSLPASPPRATGSIGGWIIDHKIGQGGFGTVYLGYKDLPDNRGKLRAAVKVINSDLREQPDYEGHVARFMAEFQILRQLDNPNCARVLDADIKAARPWMATQFVAGDSLSEELGHDGPLAGDLWWFLARDVLRGLNEAHQKNIVHRDIKPQNIMRGSRGSVLIDFGIAKMAGNPNLTGQGSPMTPAFASPEQLEGRELSPASDIFSLGHTLLFSSTGRYGFKSESLQSLVSGILTSDPDVRGVPTDIAKFIQHMMTKNPVSRPSARDALKICELRLSGSGKSKEAFQPAKKDGRSPAQGGVGNIRIFTPKAAGINPLSFRQQVKKINPVIAPKGPKANRPLQGKIRDWKDVEMDVVNFLIKAGKSQFVLPFASKISREVYFQGFFDSEGRCTLEAVSNEYLENKLSENQHEAMLNLGWEPPTEGLPNYIKFLGFDDSKKTRIGKLIVESLKAGYLEQPAALVIDPS